MTKRAPSKTKKLKACPFCAAEAMALEGVTGFSHPSVLCPKCRATIEHHDLDEARARWNQRVND